MRANTPPLYLNIIWNQHQPLYLDPARDELQAPWVRTHATKDYYDMAALVGEYPHIHCTFNLTSSLLIQLEEYYIRRLKPYYNRKSNRIDARKFLAAWKGKTDPWIDLALTPAQEFSHRDRHMLLDNTWNALFISDVMIARFPEYKLLKEKASRKESLSEQEVRDIKFWFFLAYFDPDFLERRVTLVDKSVVDLSDLLYKHYDGTYRLKKVITEDDCNRIVAETVKIIANIVPVHRKLLYNAATRKGQIDVITTAFYHPILPLIYDTEVAKICQPGAPMPPRFAYPDDARAQTVKAIAYYKKLFGKAPSGMWPAEGSVSEDALGVFAEEGISWVAADEKVLARSTPAGQPQYFPYSAGDARRVAIVFRDTRLSDTIGFTYQSWKGRDAARDFLGHIASFIPRDGEEERLLSVVLDGENAWEWYKEDNDAKEFLHSLYGGLVDLQKSRAVLTVTMSEYIAGNPSRKVPAHPVAAMKRIDRLYPGSWINANFDTWIGVAEKNRAWEYLLVARNDLGASGVPRPNPRLAEPPPGTKRWFAYKAWEELYAAEGSDWFWWYGTKQYVPGGTRPFDIAFINHLNNIYLFAKRAGGAMPEREFPSITGEEENGAVPQGTMKQSWNEVSANR